MRLLFIVARDKALRSALTHYLAAVGLPPPVDDGPDLFTVRPSRGSAVIASASEMSPASVGYLAAGHDLRVLVLAAAPSPSARDAYERQGATYVPMTVDRTTLVEPLMAMLA